MAARGGESGGAVLGIVAVVGLLVMLGVVGAVLWLATREEDVGIFGTIGAAAGNLLDALGAL